MGALEWSWKGLGDLRTFLGVSGGSEVGLGGALGPPMVSAGPNVGLGSPGVPLGP